MNLDWGDLFFFSSPMKNDRIQWELYTFPQNATINSIDQAIAAAHLLVSLTQEVNPRHSESPNQRSHLLKPFFLILLSSLSLSIAMLLIPSSSPS